MGDENYTNHSKINIITTLTTNLRAEISTNKEDFIPVHLYQVAKIDGLNKSDINNISEDIMALRQKMIRWGGHLADERINTVDIDKPC